MSYIYKDNKLKRHYDNEIPEDWKRITLDEWNKLQEQRPKPKPIKINHELNKLKYEKNTIEKRLETLSNLYTAKVHIFKEWDETDQRIIELLNEREQLRLRHDELKLLIENESDI